MTANEYNTNPKCDRCDIGEDKKKFVMKREFIMLYLGTLLYIVALIIRFPLWISFSLFLTSYAFIGRDIIWKAVKNIFHAKVFDESFLITVATIGAFAIKQFPEAVAVVLFFKIGEMLEDKVVDRSRRSIKSLLEIRPEYANLRMNGKTRKVDPKEVNVGDVIVIKPGEKVPLDGIVRDGYSMVDTSALTGESIPRSIKPNDEVLSGMINKTGLLTVQVTKIFSESTVSKILDLVEKAESKKSPTEKFISKFAKYYTPSVVFGAIALAFVPVVLYHIPIFTQMFVHEETFSEWLYRALIFLVISCPCALVISIPLGFFGGIGASSRRGVLVKGSNYLEALNNLHTIVWDKTGTLTKGIFKVAQIISKNDFSKDEVLKMAAIAESQSNHPIALSILEAFGGEIEENEVEAYEEIPGYGVKAEVKGHHVLVGNDKLLHRENIEHDVCYAEGTMVHVVIDNKDAGYIIISDEIKDDAVDAIQKLKDAGVKRQIIFTGDSEEVTKVISRRLSLDEYFAELLPQQKVEKLEELIDRKGKNTDLIAFVGDGINDAPVLMRSDIGIAMGALGSDAAIEASDIVLMTDEPSRLHEAVQIARRTRWIVWQNISFALGVKGVFLTMGILGMATMWEAVFADVGVALIAILNSTRVLK